MAATATYTKLKSGDWGIRIEGDAVPGQGITVSKKDGTTKREIVQSVIWRGNGIALATIAKSGGSGTGRRVYDNRTERESGGMYCGYPCPVSGLKCCARNGPCHDCQ